jgi:hypothetical protein
MRSNGSYPPDDFNVRLDQRIRNTLPGIAQMIEGGEIGRRRRGRREEERDELEGEGSYAPSGSRKDSYIPSFRDRERQGTGWEDQPKRRKMHG